MLGNSSKVKKALRDIVGADPNYPMNVTVIAVDGETCTVKLPSGLEIPDVRLNATVTDGEDFLLLTPVLNSDVTVLSLDGTLANLTVIKVDQIQKFEFSQSGLKVCFDSTDQKVKIENQAVNLKDLFSGLTNILKTLTVQVISTGAPSGTITPVTLVAVQQLEAQFNQLLK